MRFSAFYLCPLKDAVERFGWTGSYCLLVNHWGKTRPIPSGFAVKKKTFSSGAKMLKEKG